MSEEGQYSIHIIIKIDKKEKVNTNSYDSCDCECR